MSHACPAGCGRTVTSDRYACPRDWYRLPNPYRNAIWRTYRKEPGGAEHVQAMAAARRWYDEHPLPAPTVGGRP